MRDTAVCGTVQEYRVIDPILFIKRIGHLIYGGVSRTHEKTGPQRAQSSANCV